MSYPAGNGGTTGESVVFSYTPQLTLESVTSSLSDTYVSNSSYDAAGRLVRRSFGASGTLLQQSTDYPWSQEGGCSRSRPGQRAT
jgi:hypothetical protein